MQRSFWPPGQLGGEGAAASFSFTPHLRPSRLRSSRRPILMPSRSVASTIYGYARIGSIQNPLPAAISLAYLPFPSLLRSSLPALYHLSPSLSILSYSTLLYSTLLYATRLHSTLLYAALPHLSRSIHLFSFVATIPDRFVPSIHGYATKLVLLRR